jgi:transposase
MAYKTTLKLEVVKAYGKGMGYRVIAKKYGIGRTTVKRWIDWYQYRGAAGLQKKHSYYTVQFKKSVLDRMWRNQLSCRQVSVLFNIRNDRAVSQWERQYHAGTLDIERRRGRKKMISSKSPADQKPDEERTKEELLDQVKYLRAEVAYLKKLDALIQARKPAVPKKRR